MQAKPNINVLWQTVLQLFLFAKYNQFHKHKSIVKNTDSNICLKAYILRV